MSDNQVKKSTSIKSQNSTWDSLISWLFVVVALLSFLFIGLIGYLMFVEGKSRNLTDIVEQVSNLLWQPWLMAVGAFLVIALFSRSGIARLKPSTEDNGEDSVSESPWKNTLSLMVIGGSFLVLAALVLIPLSSDMTKLTAANKTVFDEGYADYTIQLIGLVLPVLGTWVGTVLAFYFARENLQAAQTAFIGGAAKSLKKASSAMIEMTAIPSFKSDWAKAQHVQELLKQFKEHRLERAVFLKENGHVDFILHENTITRYFSQEGNQADQAKVTLEEFLDKQDEKNNCKINELVRTFDAVSREDSVEICRLLFKSRPTLKNIIVTESGARESKPLGLITPDLLGEQPRD